MPSTIDLINRTLATPLNATVRNVYLNTTLMPPKSTAIPSNQSLSGGNNSSVYLNNTTLNPNCFNCYPNYITIGPPLITYTYYPYDYGYYGFLLVLLIAALICIKIGVSRRREAERLAAAQRRRARQQPENGNVPSSNDNNNTNVEAKEFDLPPSYDDIVKSNTSNNQLQQSTENISAEGASGITANSSTNTISAGVSTLTIETEICNSSHASTVTLNNTTITR